MNIQLKCLQTHLAYSLWPYPWCWCVIWCVDDLDQAFLTKSSILHSNKISIDFNEIIEVKDLDRLYCIECEYKT